MWCFITLGGICCKLNSWSLYNKLYTWKAQNLGLMQVTHVTTKVGTPSEAWLGTAQTFALQPTMMQPSSGVLTFINLS